MSAFILPDSHIRFIINAAMHLDLHDRVKWYTHGTATYPPHRLGELHDGTAERVGAMLIAENYESFNARYQEKGGDPHPYVHRFAQLPFAFDPVQLLRALDCYEYQTCEHDGWYESEARAFCEAVRLKAISVLPGYEKAEWVVK